MDNLVLTETERIVLLAVRDSEKSRVLSFDMPRDILLATVGLLEEKGLVETHYYAGELDGAKLSNKGRVFLYEHGDGHANTPSETRWQISKQQADKALEQSRVANIVSWIALSVSALSFLLAALH